MNIGFFSHYGRVNLQLILRINLAGVHDDVLCVEIGPMDQYRRCLTLL